MRVLPGQYLLLLLLLLYSKVVKPLRHGSFELLSEPGQRKHLEDVVRAINLIESTDPRRFRRIRTFITRIAFFNTRFQGAYIRPGRICGLRPLAEVPGKSEAVICLYASILIHEATHGLLQLRLPNCGANTKRIESICLAEQERFLSKFRRLVPDIAEVIRNNKKPTFAKT